MADSEEWLSWENKIKSLGSFTRHFLCVCVCVCVHTCPFWQMSVHICLIICALDMVPLCPQVGISIVRVHTRKYEQFLQQMTDRKKKQVGANMWCHNHLPRQSNPASIISFLSIWLSACWFRSLLDCLSFSRTPPSTQNNKHGQRISPEKQNRWGFVLYF